MPVTRTSSCVRVAANVPGRGSESDLRPIGSRAAKHAGGIPPRPVVYQRPPEQSSGAPPIIWSCRSLWKPPVLLASDVSRLPARRHRLQPCGGRASCSHFADRLCRGALGTGPEGHLRPQHGFPLGGRAGNMIATASTPRTRWRPRPSIRSKTAKREPTAEMLRERRSPRRRSLQTSAARTTPTLHDANCLVGGEEARDPGDRLHLPKPKIGGQAGRRAVADPLLRSVRGDCIPADGGTHDHRELAPPLQQSFCSAPILEVVSMEG